MQHLHAEDQHVAGRERRRRPACAEALGELEGIERQPAAVAVAIAVGASVGLAYAREVGRAVRADAERDRAHRRRDLAEGDPAAQQACRAAAHVHGVGVHPGELAGWCRAQPLVVERARGPVEQPREQLHHRWPLEDGP